MTDSPTNCRRAFEKLRDSCGRCQGSVGEAGGFRSPTVRPIAAETASNQGVPSGSLAARGQRIGEQGGSLARRRFQKGEVLLRGNKWVFRWREDVIGADGRVRRIRRAQAIGTRAEFPTKRLARRRADQLIARVNDPGYRPVRLATVADFVERYRVEVLALRKPSTVRAAESILKNHILQTLGTMRLDEVTKEVQQAFISRLSQRLTPKTVRNVAAVLAAVLNRAKEWGYVCEGMRLGSLALPSRSYKSRARFFTAEEAKRVVASAAEPFATMFAVAAMTGLRPGELLALKVEDLDFQRRIIHVRRSVWYGRMQSTKTDRERVLPMPQPLTVRLQRYLATWQPNEEGLVFATRHGTPYSANNIVQRKLWPVLDKLGIPRCGLYAFRHTHSSLLVDHGAPPTVAQAQLGHSDPRITLAVYSHVIGDSQRREVEKLAAVLDSDGPTQVGVGEWVQ